MKPADEFQEAPRRQRRGGRSGRSLRDRVVISTTFIGVVLFLLLGTPLLKRQLPPGSNILNAIGDLGVDRDRSAVRDWIRANGDDPQPQEIHWWPARDLVELHEQRLAAAREAAADDPDLADLVDQLEQNPPDRVCRLIYRTKNQAGDETTRDELFAVRSGKAHPLPRTSSLAIAARKYFPNDDTPVRQIDARNSTQYQDRKIDAPFGRPR